MAGGAHKADKDHAWQLGKAGDEPAFLAWIGDGDMWGLPHFQKLQALFYDAKNNTDTVAQFDKAIARISSVKLAKGRSVGLRKDVLAKLRQLVAGADVALPQNLDLTDAGILRDRVVGNQGIPKGEQRKANKVLLQQQQKAYRNILAGATNLCDYVADMAERAASQPADRVAIIEFETLLFHDFYRTLLGFAQGICHKQICATLNGKLRMMPTETW